MAYLTAPIPNRGRPTPAILGLPVPDISVTYEPSVAHKLIKTGMLGFFSADGDLIIVSRRKNAFLVTHSTIRATSPRRHAVSMCPAYSC